MATSGIGHLWVVLEQNFGGGDWKRLVGELHVFWA